MEIQGIKFIGPEKLDYSQLPEEKGLYIINSPIDTEFAPQYIGYSVNLKRRLRNILVHSPFPKSILESQNTTLYYAALNDMTSEEIKEIEKQLIIEYQPGLNKLNLQKEKIKQAQTNLDKTKKFANLVAGISSSIAAGITILMLSNFIFDFWGKTPSNIDIAIHKLQNEYRSNSLVIESLKKELAYSIVQLNKNVDSSQSNISTSDFIKLREDFNSINSRLSNLENAITYDPEKALSIPLIKKDLENAEKTFTNELKLSRASVDRMYDQNKWFIVLMFTIALSVLGMAVSNFIRKKE